VALSYGVGARVRRREDPRLITGNGRYVDDLNFPGMAYVVFVRSYMPHGSITRLETSEAVKSPGVVAVLTARDTEGLPGVRVNGPKGAKLPHRPYLAREVVRYQGEPLAVVIGRTREQAVDAAEKVIVELDPLPAVADPEAAQQDGSALVHRELGTNVGYVSDRTYGDVQSAFHRADKVVRARLLNQRVAGIPIEPRGVIAVPDIFEKKVSVWTSTQVPHSVQERICELLQLPAGNVRVVAPEVGGGFGTKLSVYPEDLFIPWLAMQLAIPLKWIETRSEHLQASTHGRDQLHLGELALDREGKVLALRLKILADLGAYPMGMALARLTRRIVTGCYAIPAVQADIVSVYTNKTPVAAYRGAGRPEAIFLIERLMDIAAHELQIDPAEIRRRNFMPPFSEPIDTILEERYDSGNYRAALDKALQVADYQRLRQLQKEARKRGEYLGIGIASYLEMAGFGPDPDLFESATVRIMPDASVTVLTGSAPQGQGHETAFTQLVSDRLGVPAERVTVLHGDTAEIPVGVGTFGSRTIAIGGSAIVEAAEEVIEKAKQVAADLLEAAPADITVNDGHWQVRGSPSRSVELTEIASAAYKGGRPQGAAGLESTRFFQPAGLVFPFGAHVAVVKVDPETGQAELLRYISVDDCGLVLNPLLAEGQVHGGLAQGIAQAIFEEIAYDENGQLLSGNLTTYLAPTAADLPSFMLDRTVTPTSVNPLGMKGIGEAATIGSTPAVVNAVVDALVPLGVKELDPPCSPLKIWKALSRV
jgi:carbon-monoxide dehydrogenase large subunit